MTSPLQQDQETLKKKKKNKHEKVITHDPGPIIPRTCFICGNRFPHTIHALHRTFDDGSGNQTTHMIRVCPSCQVGLTKFTPMNANTFIINVTEGRETIVKKAESTLMKLNKADLVAIIFELYELV